MAQQWPHGAPDPIFPQNPPIWGQTILVPMPDGSYVPQTVPFGYQQPGQGFVGQPNPFGKPDPNVAYRPQGPPTPPAPALGPPTRPDVDVRGLAPRLGKERKFGLASQVQLRKGTAEDRTRHRRRPHMMLLLTEVDEAVPPSGANRDRDFLQKANWGRQEIEEEDPYYVEATNFPVVQQAVGRIYLDRTSASFLEWSWAMAEEQEQLNTALGAIVSGSGHLETKYANEKPENYAFLADMAEKYIDVRLRAVGSMQNRERDVWKQPFGSAMVDYAAQWNTLYNDHGPQLPSDKNASAPLLKITDRNDLARLRQNAYFAITRLPFAPT
ncbi:hypothetical protein QBC34DRAFT_498747 [Podospora aff. communis PSN243]|uniref:Uncharacterized protein n=1 Tax=Podospora aff. communis PSN243 TaxID=3040156 RepID=A0AAV9G5R3_9PEZI|nr:hypothetical protein QBC34DRAFT_498747 [Podospora aff. communis PSN243]